MTDLITRLRERAAMARGRAGVVGEVCDIADGFLNVPESATLRLGLPPIVEAAHHANLALDLEEGADALERLDLAEARNNQSVCVWCGDIQPRYLDDPARTVTAMIEHARGCGKRPENRLVDLIERARAALGKGDLVTALAALCETEVPE